MLSHIGKDFTDTKALVTDMYAVTTSTYSPLG